MAVFNLLPGYPMDGGRVLRATLWFLGDEMLPATRVAAQAGRLCGWVLGLGGLALAIAAREPLAAVWAGLVGFFLYRTASSSYRGLRLQLALQGTTVGDLMQRRLRTVPPDLSLEQFVAGYVLGQAETGFPVVELVGGEDEHLVGMMTLRNLRRFTTAQWSELRVAEAMTPATGVPTLTPETSAFDALYILKDNSDGLVPVVTDGRLVGVLRRRDVALFVQVQLARRQK
jgi:CBS domain-containing protein